MRPSIPKKRASPAKVFTLSAAVVLFLWVIAQNGWLAVSPDNLSALFTGLGFAGLIATFLHEREQAIDSEEESEKLLDALRETAEALNRSAKEQARARYLQTIASRVEANTALLNAHFDAKQKLPGAMELVWINEIHEMRAALNSESIEAHRDAGLADANLSLHNWGITPQKSPAG